MSRNIIKEKRPDGLHNFIARVPGQHEKKFRPEVYGDEEKALRAAETWAETLRTAHARVPMRRDPRNGAKGAVVGVYRREVPKGSGCYSWVAEWNPVPNKRVRIIRSIAKYGEQRAKQLAIEERDRQMNQGMKDDRNLQTG